MFCPSCTAPMNKSPGENAFRCTRTSCDSSYFILVLRKPKTTTLQEAVKVPDMTYEQRVAAEDL